MNLFGLGLHVGPVVLRENTADDVARGAKPIEVEGLAKPIAARVMSVARGGQSPTLHDVRNRPLLGCGDPETAAIRHGCRTVPTM